MQLWLLTNNDVRKTYDVYYSMVIAAKDNQDALYLSFVHSGIYEDRPWAHTEPEWRHYHYNRANNQSWTEKPEIELLASYTLRSEGVVCAAYRGG